MTEIKSAETRNTKSKPQDDPLGL